MKPVVTKQGNVWIVTCAEKKWYCESWKRAIHVAVKHFTLHPDHSRQRALLIARRIPKMSEQEKALLLLHPDYSRRRA